jgi:dUTP pyrophosphatase
VTSEEAGGWRRFAADKLSAPVFDPYAAFGRLHVPNDEKTREMLQEVNYFVIDRCEVLLVNGSVPGGHVTWDETSYALRLEKGVVIFGGKNGYVEFASMGAHVFDSLIDAIGAADELHKQKLLACGFTERAVTAKGEVVPTGEPGTYGFEPLQACELPDLKLEEDIKPYDVTGGRLYPLKFMIDKEACGDYVPEIPAIIYDGDVGFDIPCAKNVVCLPGKMTIVRLAFRIEPPPGFWWELQGRSSTWRRAGLQVERGIIDNGYRGPLWAGVHNPTSEIVHIFQGDRIVQCILHRIERMRPVLVQELSSSERGEAGFGSSGK